MATTPKKIEQLHEAIDPAVASALIDPLSNANAVADARRWPRSVDGFLKKTRQWALHDDAAAENCIYSLPRGGKPIIGASIGFADILASSYGNCRAAGIALFYDPAGKYVRAAGLFKDFESNTELVASVDRPTVDRNGRPYNDDMRRITMQAACSIARRNVVLHAVPPGLWRPIFDEARRIVAGDVETFSVTKGKALQAMSQFGVKPEQVYGLLGIKGEMDLKLDHIPIIRGMYRALRDGEISVEEMFDPRRMSKSGFETVDNPLGDDPVAETPAEAQAAPAEAQVADETAGLGEEVGSEAVQEAQGSRPAASAEEGAGVMKAEENAPVAATGADADTTRGQLRSPEEYLSYWEGFLATCTSRTAVQQRWFRDRALRGNCRVIGETFADAERMRRDAEERLT